LINFTTAGSKTTRSICYAAVAETRIDKMDRLVSQEDVSVTIMEITIGGCQAGAIAQKYVLFIFCSEFASQVLNVHALFSFLELELIFA